MRKVFEDPDFTKVGWYESILNAQGIATELRNEDLSSVTGSPYVGAYPELWVVDEARYDEALALLESFESAAPADGPEWRCPQCGERVPASFQSCWKCGASRPPQEALA